MVMDFSEFPAGSGIPAALSHQNGDRKPPHRKRRQSMAAVRGRKFRIKSYLERKTNAKHGVRQSLEHGTLHFNSLFFRHLILI